MQSRAGCRHLTINYDERRYVTVKLHTRPHNTTLLDACSLVENLLLSAILGGVRSLPAEARLRIQVSKSSSCIIPACITPWFFETLIRRFFCDTSVLQACRDTRSVEHKCRSHLRFRHVPVADVACSHKTLHISFQIWLAEFL